MKPKIYLAHPVSGAPLANALAAARWIRWLTIQDSGRLYIAPWVAEVIGFGNVLVPDGFYQYVLDDDIEVVSVCQGLIAVGGRWSLGMLQERSAARALGIPVLDATKYITPDDVRLTTRNHFDEWLRVLPGTLGSRLVHLDWTKPPTLEFK